MKLFRFFVFVSFLIASKDIFALSDEEVQRMQKIDKDFANAEILINETWQDLPKDVKSRLKEEQVEWIRSIRDKQAKRLIDEGQDYINAYTKVTLHRVSYLKAHAYEGSIKNTGKYKEGTQGWLWVHADNSTRFLIYKAVIDGVKTSCDLWVEKDHDYALGRIKQEPERWQTYSEEVEHRWRMCDPHTNRAWGESFDTTNSDMTELYQNDQYQDIPFGAVMIILNESYMKKGELKYERLLFASEKLNKWLEEKKEEEIFRQKALLPE